MRLRCLGVGDAFAARYWSTCAIVEHRAPDGVDRRLLVDCPHPIRRILAEHALDVHDLDGVVITHCHADHVSGLEGLLFFAHFVLRRKLPLYAHPEVLAELWGGHLRAGMRELLHADGHRSHHELADYAELRPLDEAAPARFFGLELDCRRTIHHVPTFALRFRSASASLGWSADTAFDEGLLAWLGACDRFVHETNLGVHTPYDKLAALPPDVRARMWLVHYLDTFDVEGSVIECLRERQTYEIRATTTG